MQKKYAQMWFTDFTIAILIFSFVLISYYTYTTNLSKQGSVVVDDLFSDVKTVSSSLTTGGYPDNWKADTVTRIGFTDNNNRIDNVKFNEFVKIDYNKSKKLFGTIYDYFLFFINESGNLQNVEGFCGTGFGEVNISYNLSSAYYFQGPGHNDFLKSFIESTFNADVYCERPQDCPGSTLDDLITNINNYGMVIVEAPDWSVGSQYDPFKTVAEPWVEAGGFLMISGELVSGQKKEMVGVAYEKGAGLSSSQEHATVVNEDEFVDFELTAGLIFDQGFTVEDVISTPEAAGFKAIARFNESDIEYEDILDNKIAVARWDYGDGRVFFFSDFDSAYLAGDFQSIVEISIKRWIGAQCLPIDISNVKRDNLVKVERLLIYNSKPIKMVLYLWQ